MAASDPARAARDRAIFRAYQGGDSTCELAARHKLSFQRITQIVTAESRRRGVPLRPPLPRGGKFTLPTDWTVPEDLCEDYHCWRKSAGDIARLLGRTYYATVQALKAQGVTRDEADRPPTLEARIYAAFKAGKSMPELEVEFGVSRGHVAAAIGIARRKSKKPYYWYPTRRRG